jgi:hypothetical protein
MSPTVFDFFDLPDPTRRGFVVTAKEDNLSDTIPDFTNTTVLWSDCPAWVKRAFEVRGDFQSYRLVYAKKSGYQLRSFYFAPPITTEEAETPFRTYYETEPSMFWPKVMLSFQTYKRITDDQWITRPTYKEAYQGPTRVLIEEFYSPTPFTIPIYAPLIASAANVEIGAAIASTAGLYWASVGTLSVESSLHPSIVIIVPLDPPITVGVISYLMATASVAGTTYTDWPDTLVVDDRQREILGGFVRRRVTAIRPGSPAIVYVTLSTSASITSTTATLGGTVTIPSSAVVTSRGVSYALASQNADPEVGGTSVTTATTSGTMGVFTVSITSLTIASNYRYKPWALTSQGVYYYGPLGDFTTLAIAPTVTTPTSASVTDVTADLGGNVTSDGGGTVTARGVVYSLTATNAAPQIGGTGVTNAVGTGTTGVFTVGVSGLTASSGYSYAAYATNSIGTTYSSVGTFTTAA